LFKIILYHLIKIVEIGDDVWEKKNDLSLCFEMIFDKVLRLGEIQKNVEK